jgi:hypothetical protein
MRWILGGVLLSASVVVVAPASAAVCAKPHEHTALKARVLQTELMVAALACQHQQLYNQFVTKFQEELVKEGKSLQGYFSRQHGAGGQQRLNAMITRLANEASQLSMNQPIGFCQQSSLLFSEALSTSPKDFGKLLDKPALKERHGVQPCAGTGKEPVTVGLDRNSQRSFSSQAK